MTRTSASRLTHSRSSSRRLLLILAGTVLVVGSTGCSTAPTFNILGSYFPSWILCCAIAALVTFAAHVRFTKTKLVRELWPLPLVYTALFCMVSCTVWLIFFA